MAFVVVYDANVLYPSTLRDLLVRIAQSGLVRAKWTEQILDEAFGALVRDRPDLNPDKIARTRALLNRAVRDCLVTGYEPITDTLHLPDPDDRHVLAAAIRCHAQLIVTGNLKHFPATHLQPWDIEAKHPDDFLLDQLDLDEHTVIECVRAIARSRQHPPESPDDVATQLARHAPRAAETIRTRLH